MKIQTIKAFTQNLTSPTKMAKKQRNVYSKFEDLASSIALDEDYQYDIMFEMNNFHFDNEEKTDYSNPLYSKEIYEIMKSAKSSQDANDKLFNLDTKKMSFDLIKLPKDSLFIKRAESASGRTYYNIELLFVDPSGEFDYIAPVLPSSFVGEKQTFEENTGLGEFKVYGVNLK